MGKMKTHYVKAETGLRGKRGPTGVGRRLEDGTRKINRNNLDENAITGLSLFCILIKKKTNKNIYRRTP